MILNAPLEHILGSFSRNDKEFERIDLRSEASPSGDQCGPLQGGGMSEFFHSYLHVCNFLLARWLISTLNSNAIKLEKANMDKNA